MAVVHNTQVKWVSCQIRYLNKYVSIWPKMIDEGLQSPERIYEMFKDMGESDEIVITIDCAIRCRCGTTTRGCAAAWGRATAE